MCASITHGGVARLETSGAAPSLTNPHSVAESTKIFLNSGEFCPAARYAIEHALRSARWSKMRSVLQIIACWLIVQSCLIAQTTRSQSELIAALDLSRPELAKVKAAADQQDFAAARKAFAQYLRTRRNVVWRFDPDHPPASLTPAMRATAD